MRAAVARWGGADRGLRSEKWLEVFGPGGAGLQQPRRRTAFDVFLEETTVAEDYSAHDSGFRTADILEIEVDVADGFVDVHFGRRDENPNIAAIEVIRKDG